MHVDCFENRFYRNSALAYRSEAYSLNSLYECPVLEDQSSPRDPLVKGPHCD